MNATQDRTAVAAVVDALVEAWGRHDADAYGGHFTEDATYITFAGTRYQGRRDIVESHRALFGSFLKGTRLADEITDIRFPAPGVAVVTGRGDTHKGGRPAKLRKVQTYTLVREADGVWRISAFQNTKRSPLMERISFRIQPATRPSPAR